MTPTAADRERAREAAEGYAAGEMVTYVEKIDAFLAGVEWGREEGAAGEREKELEDLVSHMWVHNGYKQCGRDQMTTEQKALYDEITTRETP